MYIHCIKQIGESAPLEWTGIASRNKTFARLLSVVTVKPVNHQCNLFVWGSVGHLYKDQAATVIEYKDIQIEITLELYSAILVKNKLITSPDLVCAASLIEDI